MRQVSLLLLTAVLMCAQNGQQESRPGWLCISGRAVDPAYIETSESTGGQVFLFQKDEIAQSTPALMATSTHPATITRGIGNLAGAREFQFNVDSTVESLLVLASLQCRKEVTVFRPSGEEMISYNSNKATDLKTGKILRVDYPEPGIWKLRVSGEGLLVFSVMAKTSPRLPSLRLRESRLGVRQDVDVSLPGEITGVKSQLVNAAGDAASEPEAADSLGNGAYRISVTPTSERFRVRILATDANGRQLERMWPVLLRAAKP
jgi:hypothetical protein